MIKEVTVIELKNWIDTNEDFQLVDVREPHELEIATIGGENIPLYTVPENLEKIALDKKVVVICRSGKRSATAIALIQERINNSELYNLKGGILAWSDKIDNSIEKY